MLDSNQTDYTVETFGQDLFAEELVFQVRWVGTGQRRVDYFLLICVILRLLLSKSPIQKRSLSSLQRWFSQVCHPSLTVIAFVLSLLREG